MGRPLAAGDRVTVEKGCQARGVVKGSTALLCVVEPQGAEGGHMVKLVLEFRTGGAAGKKLAFYARHPNRLTDPLVAMNDGNPLHRIQVRLQAKK